MCNRFRQLDFWPEIETAGIQILWPERPRRNAPIEDTRPTDMALVLRWQDGRAVAEAWRWGFPPPPGRKGGPVINYRSEGRDFGTRRCLVPAELFYEFTGERSPKTRWAVRPADARWMCMAGVWREARDGLPATFSILTTAPGPDIQTIHDRETVTIAPQHWRRWLSAADDARDLLAPRPQGTFVIERAPPDAPTPTRRKPSEPATGSLF